MPAQFDTQLFEELGYSSFIHSATKKGYSGVAILSKIAPKNIQYGCGIEEIDLILLIGSNPRYEATILNAMIKWILKYQ